jgi:hypothetical protein
MLLLPDTELRKVHTSDFIFGVGCGAMTDQDVTQAWEADCLGASGG